MGRPFAYPCKFAPTLVGSRLPSTAFDGVLFLFQGDCEFLLVEGLYLLVLFGWPKPLHCPVKGFDEIWVIHAQEGPASVSGPCRLAAARPVKAELPR